LARLLVQNPRAILADEPVSALDPARAEDLIRLLVGIADEGGRTPVASLHTVPLALEYFDRIVALRDGQIEFDLPARAVRTSHMEALYALPDQASLEAADVEWRRSPVAARSTRTLSSPPEAR
jgi:phosphonate transport system ATP-binding protein